MIAANHNGRFDVAAFHQLVYRHAKLGAFAVAEPTNPRRQSLISNSLLREHQPTRQRLIFWEQFEREFVGARDVSGITAQRNPAKRAAPFAKQRPNIFENEPGNIERVFHSGFFCLGANVIAIIERNGAFLLQCEHCLDVHAHGVHCSLNIFFRIFPRKTSASSSDIPCGT